VNVEIHRGVQVVVDTIEKSVDRFLQKALEHGTLDEGAFKRLTQIRGMTLPNVLKEDESEKN
jgi:hypothetical protein